MVELTLKKIICSLQFTMIFSAFLEPTERGCLFFFCSPSPFPRATIRSAEDTRDGSRDQNLKTHSSSSLVRRFRVTGRETPGGGEGMTNCFLITDAGSDGPRKRSLRFFHSFYSSAPGKQGDW